MIGVPVVRTYKYLGMMLNGQLDIKDHLKLINKKANYITYKLYGLRMLDDTRININMFRVFVLPSYRLAHTLYARLSTGEQEAVDRHLRVWCKKFARIPVNTAGHTFLLIAGDLKV